MSDVIVKLSSTEVNQALKNFAAQKLSGTKLTADTVIIKTETRDGHTAEVSFKESTYNSSYYDR